MEENLNSFNISFYRSIVAQDNGHNIYKTAATQRKCTVLSFEAACKSLDNASTCDLLMQKLENYTKTVYKDGNNIYNSLLLEAHPNISSERQFKVPNNLPKTDLNVHLTDLGCTDSTKIFCNKSEKQSQAELNQFANFLTNKKDTPSTKTTALIKNKFNWEDRFQHVDKLQRSKTDVFETSQHSSTSNIKEQKLRKNDVTLHSFITARDELNNQGPNAIAMGGMQQYSEKSGNGGQKRRLGLRKTARSKFVSPLLSNKSESSIEEKVEKSALEVDERLKHIEPKMVELIMAEIMDQGPNIDWNDIAGLEFAKSAIQEAVVWPMLRPDIFTGLRRPPKGILLFGPPGTGKTLIGKCVASQSKSTFFSISASSLTSKWIGDGEKMVRTLFAVARVHQPAVIFIDEVDSLLTQRSDTEHESSRRIKTEFLVQLDGATTDSEERLLVIGATNRPQELDEAARRRFVKRLYIPLPEFEARQDLLKKLISSERHSLTDEQFTEVARLSEGFSGADIKNLCSEAALGPIRSIDFRNIANIQASEVRPLSMLDFEKSLKRVRPSVSQNDLVNYIQWDNIYGSVSGI